MKVMCLKCKDIIRSKHRHDYVTCKCGAISVDGGDDYLRINGKQRDYLTIKEDDSGKKQG